jgi:hypothetical protein
MPQRFGSAGNASPGQAYSDIASDDGRNGAYGINSYSSSAKAQNLASEIAGMEQRFDYLETRNKWLTEKLLGTQRAFIERTMVGSSKIILKQSFKAWCDVLDMLRYEKQLQVQTDDARKCQQVAKELGAALAREQEVSRNHQEMRMQIEAQFTELVEANATLKQSTDKQAAQITVLQRQISLIMGGLERNKSEAESIVDSVDDLQKKMRALKNEDLGQVQLSPSNSRIPDAIEESVKLRDETQDLMNSMSGLLRQSQTNNSSPERERRNTGDQFSSSRAVEAGRGGYPQTQQRSTDRASDRSPSPMDNRFQSVNSIVAELEQAPMLASGSDLLRGVGFGTRASDVASNLGQAGGARSNSLVGVDRSPIFGRQAALSSFSNTSASRR